MQISARNYNSDPMETFERILVACGPDLANHVRPGTAAETAARMLWIEAGGNVDQFVRWLKRYLAGDQPEYILGWQLFDGVRYHADRRAYIAQDDSLAFLDRLVAEAQRLVVLRRRALRICEVGVGGGAFLCALSRRCAAAALPVLDWLGLDIDGAALNVAAINCEMAQLRVRLIESDILAELETDAAPDMIFAYPPWGNRFAPGDRFTGTEWELFHRALPQISCYVVGGETRVHEEILEQAHRRFPGSEVHIFNDYLPQSEIDRVLALHPNLMVEPCGPSMTAFAKRG
ncbi:class I SAM-dependent methyltransferase [Sinorhizobium terangae]|nr:hypothetical protein [Sinorhizobium terangae]